jgi:hypothetical protein
MTRRLAQLILLSYPLAFRRRYGDSRKLQRPHSRHSTGHPASLVVV